MRTSRQRTWWAIGIAMAVALAASCEPSGEQKLPQPQPRQPQPTPKADFTTKQLLNSDSVSLDKFKTYLATLHFDADLGPSDLRHVDLEQSDGRTERRALVWIQPEEGSHLLEDKWKEGRVIAQIWSDHRYPRLGLEAGWNWWWVAQDGDTRQSVFVAEKTNKRTPARLDVVDHYERGTGWKPWKRAIARLVPGSVYTWGTCGGSCCQS